MLQEKTFLLPVRRHIGKPCRICRADAGERTADSSDRGLGSRGRLCAVEAEQKVVLTLTNQPADADDLPGGPGEIDVARHAGGKPPQAEKLVRGGGILIRREQSASVAADHQPDETLAIHAGQRLIGGHDAILQHGHMRTERLDLVQPVRDVEKCDTFGRKP